MIDVSVELKNGMPSWPGDAAFRREWSSVPEEHGAKPAVSRVSCSVHVGTHVDSPLHFFSDGRSVEQIPLSTLVGPVAVRRLEVKKRVEVRHLGTLELKPDVKRLLLRTSNSRLWHDRPRSFSEDFVSLSPGAARWLVDRGIELIGVDYLSVEAYDAPDHETHEILLEAGVVIVEGLDLSEVEPGEYVLMCMPLKIRGAEGAPARAALVPRSQWSEIGGVGGDG